MSSLPLRPPAEYSARMRAMYSNGQQWENLAIELIDLFGTLNRAMDSVPCTWLPTLPSTKQALTAADAWRIIEARYRESVHEAARALIGTAEVPDPRPEIIYFLGLRLRAALSHVESMSIIKDQKPMSLWAFPALPPNEVLQWLLTGWADEHTIMVAFPEASPPTFVFS